MNRSVIILIRDPKGSDAFVMDEHLSFIESFGARVWFPESDVKGMVDQYQHNIMGQYSVIRIKTEDDQLSKTLIIKRSDWHDDHIFHSYRKILKAA